MSKVTKERSVQLPVSSYQDPTFILSPPWLIVVPILEKFCFKKESFIYMLL